MCALIMIEGAFGMPANRAMTLPVFPPTALALSISTVAPTHNTFNHQQPGSLVEWRQFAQVPKAILNTFLVDH